MDYLPPWEPPMSGSEHAHLLGMLDRLRVTFRYKTDGLGIEQLAFKLPSSDLSLGGLLQHLSTVEDEKFTYLISRERPIVLLELTAEGQDPFDVNLAEDPTVLYSRYDRAVEKSRKIQSEIITPRALGEPSALEFAGQHASIRRVICDLIEEYGRHTGHADLLREAIDGRVGEDPPFEYRPAWHA